MKAEVVSVRGTWEDVYFATMNTIGKERIGVMPSEKWIRKIIKAEHSPIRCRSYMIKLTGIPYWVSVHLTRHKIGIEHFVTTQRTDRTGEERGVKPQDALVDHVIDVNLHALVNISRKRLCMCASPETRQIWKMIVDAVVATDPFLEGLFVKECVYRGHCPEFHGCGYDGTQKCYEEIKNYVKN